MAAQTPDTHALRQANSELICTYEALRSLDVVMQALAIDETNEEAPIVGLAGVMTALRKDMGASLHGLLNAQKDLLAALGVQL